MVDAHLKRLLQGLRPDAGLVVLTGAGISRESGLHTFRDADGIWAQVRLEEVATPQAFARDPARVQGFYNARRRAVLDPSVGPNAAHDALVRLENGWRGPFLLVTQNVDDLHDRAGSSRLLPMHGALLKIRCTACDRITRFTGDLETGATCPDCGAGGSLRPHIVWFGEMPLFMEEIGEALADAGLFIAIGTSGTVYPAAGFAAEARAHGAITLEINMEETGGRFDGGLYGPATHTVPALVDFLLKEVR
ncbi:NAD-dependent deacylase [Niveispirillum sp.]|uniref:NAD-dependent deacylase n=1 Tax=Niveispirillum sp. TaxID=1917217 RepID=UPI001B76C6C9|nr:NAD-dependent deacylase [Niveispirillum sp.]MBP7334398.1 NAD-dependent deacylase [Niveispirillum sp.]